MPFTLFNGSMWVPHSLHLRAVLENLVRVIYRVTRIERVI